VIDWDALFSPTFVSRVIFHARNPHVWGPLALALSPIILLVIARMLLPRRRMLQLWIAGIWIAVCVPTFLLSPAKPGAVSTGAAIGVLLAALGLAKFISHQPDQP
jgi:hypothetical protein